MVCCPSIKSKFVQILIPTSTPYVPLRCTHVSHEGRVTPPTRATDGTSSSLPRPQLRHFDPSFLRTVEKVSLWSTGTPHESRNVSLTTLVSQSPDLPWNPG